MKKQLKDQEFRLATIKIIKLRSVTQDGAFTEYRDKMWVIDIKQGNRTRGYNVRNERDFWRELKKELYL